MSFDAAYAKVATKYKLPSFEDLDKELDLSGGESERFPLIHVRNRLADKINFWLDLLESILSPDPSRTSALHETRYFGDTDRNKVFALYKRLMVLDRCLVEAAVTSDEKLDARVLKDIWSQWDGLKTEVLEIVVKMKESWQKELARDENLGYLG